MGITDVQKRELDEQGCIVIPDVLSDAEIKVYKADILRLAEEEKQNGLARQHTDGYGQHVRWLVNKGKIYEKLVAHPKVMPFFEHVLGPDYTLSTLTSNIIDPGASDGGYHVDSVLGTMPRTAPQFPTGRQQPLAPRRFYPGKRWHTPCTGYPPTTEKTASRHDAPPRRSQIVRTKRLGIPIQRCDLALCWC